MSVAPLGAIQTELHVDERLNLHGSSEHQAMDGEAQAVAVMLISAFIYGSIGILWLTARVSPVRSEAFRVALLCATWSSMSVGMSLVNKTLVEILHAPCLISVFQMVIAATWMVASSYNEMSRSSRPQLLRWLLVPGFYSAMLVSGFYTQEYISLTLLTVVRNLSPALVMPVEWLCMKAPHRPVVTVEVVGSLLVMTAGAIVYMSGLTDFSVIGIGFAVLNLVLACVDRMVQRRLLCEDCKGLTNEVCTFINNSVGLLPPLVLAFATHEVNRQTGAHALLHWRNPIVLALLLLSGAIGLGICYFGIACQRLITVTSFMVMQNFSKVIVIAMGVGIYGDPIKSPVFIAGLVLSIGGSLMYGRSQIRLLQLSQGERQPLVLGKDDKDKLRYPTAKPQKPALARQDSV